MQVVKSNKLLVLDRERKVLVLKDQLVKLSSRKEIDKQIKMFHGVKFLAEIKEENLGLYSMAQPRLMLLVQRPSPMMW